MPWTLYDSTITSALEAEKHQLARCWWPVLSIRHGTYLSDLGMKNSNLWSFKNLEMKNSRKNLKWIWFLFNIFSHSTNLRFQKKKASTKGRRSPEDHQKTYKESAGSLDVVAWWHHLFQEDTCYSTWIKTCLGRVVNQEPYCHPKILVIEWQTKETWLWFRVLTNLGFWLRSLYRNYQSIPKEWWENSGTCT